MRKNQSHAEKTREKIKTSMLVNRLQDHVLSGVEMTSGQIRAAEILLKKTVPDLKQMEVSGIDGEAIKMESKTIMANMDQEKASELYKEMLGNGL